MKLANVLEGGIAGATTLGLLQEAIANMDASKGGSRFQNRSGILKKIKKESKKGNYAPEIYIKLAGELLSSAAYYGLTVVGRKKNVVLRGALIGAAAGIGAIVFDNKEDNPTKLSPSEEFRNNLLTLALYTTGGLLAGAAVKKLSRKKRKKR
jgi:hypothetical protein